VEEIIFVFCAYFLNGLKKFIEILTNCIKEFKGLIKILTKLIITLAGILVNFIWQFKLFHLKKLIF
jgi:hypothetical protein